MGKMWTMGKTLIFGHKNPDTDSICSALAYAELKWKIGAEVEAVRLGAVSAETQFALDRFQMTAPRLVETVAGEASQVILVDHNECQQSATDIRDVTIAEVIDHHRIANFETAGPLYYRAEPVGCTCTILFKMFREKGVAPSPRIAGLMLSAILSDTLLFQSPTCTAEDIAAAEELAPLAGVDPKVYGLEMLRAGAALADKSISQLVAMDSKEFSMGAAKVEIAQVNAVDVAEVLSRQEELEAALRSIVAEKGLDLFLFVVTDILSSESVGIALGPRASAVESAYDVTLENNRALLKGVVSRKSQIVPVLTETFSRG
ncbi:MAG: manganese-dependent inorganic pyrophosphatase [Mycobacterium sp.]